jgi:hypothetical protein
MLEGKRIYGVPIIVGQGGSISRPKRIPFTEKMLQEGWIQERIRENPELLPINDIEPVFCPLISVGREVSTTSGYIDNLFLSTQGYLTIVETKLWRNPEARREVVGQIIDYAKDISQWTFNDLEKVVREYNKKYRNQNMGIIDTIRLLEQIDEQDESLLIDTISNNLKNGRFLLLIVGDGIRESVEEMASYLQRTPQLYFTLALVELQLFKLESANDDSIMIIPQVVLRTKEVTRAIVRIESKDVTKVDVYVPDETIGKEKPKRFTLTEDEFFKHLETEVGSDEIKLAHQIKDDVQNIGCIVEWKQASFAVKLPDAAGSGQNFTLFLVYKNGNIQTVGWFTNALKALNLPIDIGRNYLQQLAKLFNCKVQPNTDSLSNSIPLRELSQKYPEFLDIVKNFIYQFEKASQAIS